MRVYIDGIFDLFHIGHIEAINQCFKYGNEIIVGVVSDKDAESYKRIPYINENDRVEILKNIKNISKVIFPCPLVITKEFIINNNIDIVVHSFFDDKDYEKQKNFFKIPIDMGIFKKINYSSKLSTTDIINKIRDRI